MVAVNNTSNPFAAYGSYLNNVSGASPATTDLLSRAAGFNGASSFDANAAGAAFNTGSLSSPINSMGGQYGSERSLYDLTSGATNRYFGNSAYGVPSMGDNARGFQLGNLGNVLNSFGNVATSAGQLVNSVGQAVNSVNGNGGLTGSSVAAQGGSVGGPWGWSGGPPSAAGRDMKDPNVAAQFQEEMMAYQRAMEIMKMAFEMASNAERTQHSTSATISGNMPR